MMHMEWLDSQTEVYLYICEEETMSVDEWSSLKSYIDILITGASECNGVDRTFAKVMELNELSGQALLQCVECPLWEGRKWHTQRVPRDVLTL